MKNTFLFFIFILSVANIQAQSTLDEQLKAARYDYDEKLYGQALDSYKKVLKQNSKTISETQINNINLKMAHCLFELRQYYKSTILLDKFIGTSELYLTFKKSTFLSPSSTTQKLWDLIQRAPIKKTVALTDLIGDFDAKQEVDLNVLLEYFNTIISDPELCKSVINAYKRKGKWINQLILEIPINKNEKQNQLLTRLIFEGLYPLQSYVNNKKLKVLDEKDAIIIVKNKVYYDALYWRARINLINHYYSDSNEGFEEVLRELNYKQYNRIIECKFYKALCKFHMKQNKTTLEELGDLHILYNLRPYYKSKFYEQTYHYLGRAYFELSRFDFAIKKFRILTAGYDNREPKNKLIRDSYFWLGESYYCKGEFNKAIKFYNVVTQYGTFKEKENALYSLAWAWFKKQDIGSQAKAKIFFELLLKTYPNTKFKLKSQLKLAEIFIEAGNAKEGEALINKLKNSSTNKSFFEKEINALKQTDFLIGLVYQKNKEYKKALKYYVESDDTTNQLLKQKIALNSGICYKQLKEIKLAVKFLSTATKMPASLIIQIKAKSLLADTLFDNRAEENDIKDAISIYKELIKSNPNHPLNLHWRWKEAKALRQNNQDDKAIDILNNILKENKPEWEKAQMEIGNILLAASPNRYNEAVKHFLNIQSDIESKDVLENAILNYAICLYKTDKPTTAINILEELAKTAKNGLIITDAYQYMAVCFTAAGDTTNALKIYEKSLKEFPKQRNATIIHKECAKLYHKLKNYEKSIKHLNSIFKNENDNEMKANTLLKLAGYELQLAKSGYAKRAIEKFKKIISDFKKSSIAPKASYQLAQFYKSTGDMINAKKYFQISVDEFKNEEIKSLSYYELASETYKNNNYKQAITLYNKVNFNIAKEKSPLLSKKETTYKNRANCHYQLNNFPIAKDEYMGLIRLNRNNMFYKIRYANSCLKSKLRLGDAISILERIPEKQKTKESDSVLEKIKSLQLKLKTQN